MTCRADTTTGTPAQRDTTFPEPDAADQPTWRVDLSLEALPYLADHRIEETVVVPGSSYVALALAAASRTGETPERLDHLVFPHAFYLPEHGTRTLRLTLTPDEHGASFHAYSQAAGAAAGSSVSHARLRLSKGPADSLIPSTGTPPALIRSRCPTEIDGEAWYTTLAEGGNQYGPTFRHLRRLWRGQGEALGAVQVPSGRLFSEATGAFLFPLLDAATQVLHAAREGKTRPFVLVSCHCLRLYARPEGTAWLYAQGSPEPDADGSLFAGDVQALDEDGRRLIEFQGVRLRYLPAATQPVDEEAAATLAIAASFTAEPLEESLAFWMEVWDAPTRITLAPSNQIFQQLLDPGSTLARNRDGVNVVLLRFEDWIASGLPLAIDRPAGEELLADRPRHLLPNQVEIAHLNAYETDYLYREIFVEQAYLRHGITLGPACCIVDVGANIGLFTLFVLTQCPAAQIYAFEPSPDAFDALRINAARYGPDVKLFNMGLSDVNGTAPFTSYPHASVFSGFHADREEDRAALRTAVRNLAQRTGTAADPLVDTLVEARLEGETITRPTRTLSSMIAAEQIDHIDLLKIDAEKSELAVLGGIEAADWDRIRQVVVEVHDHEGTRLDAVVALLEEQGFRCATAEAALLRGTGLYTVYAIRPGPPAQAVDPAFRAHLEQTVDELVQALHTLRNHASVPLLFGICPPTPSAPSYPAQQALFARLTRRLATALRTLPEVSLIVPNPLSAPYPVVDYYDSYSDALARIPYTPRYFTALGTQLAREVLALRRPPYKVIVLDCDQTLWQGVCGEDGPHGVAVDEQRRQFQAFVVAQRAVGMLLCLCSRNNEDDVWAVFDHHQEMPLRREHLAAWRINWEPKSANLKSLAQELQLGLNSFIFIDDDPVACAEVQARCPEVLTLRLPPEAEHIPSYLAHVWAFDRPPPTEDDRQRPRRYEEGRRRAHFRRAAQTFEAFLDGLDLQIHCTEAAPVHLARVAQLTRRTNQFNTTARRRSETELRTLLRQGALEGFVVEVRDRFGDYGLVGVVFFATLPDSLRIDTFLLSCRALGRGVEHRMLARLGALALERGLCWVEVAFHPTGRNLAALDFLQQTSRAAGLPAADGTSDRYVRFPATAAAAVTFVPPAASPPPSRDEGPPPAASVAPAPSQLSQRVATEWRDLDAITAQIQARKHRVPAKRGMAAPGDTLERAIAGLWQEVLGTAPVGLHDDFFALGGTSLQAVQILARLYDLFQVEVSLSHLMESSTVAGLARRIIEACWTAPDEAPPPLKPTRISAPPLSFAQQRLWFVDQVETGSPFYNVPLAFRLTGPLDRAVLADSLNRVAARHGALRTTVRQEDGHPVQVVASTLRVDVPVLDLSAVPAVEREAEAFRLAQEEAQRPFDIERGPLLRAGLLRLSEHEHLLLLTSHHLVMDAWSVHLMLRELESCYRAAHTGEALTLPLLPVQYADYAVWQRAWLHGNTLPARLASWKQHLADVTPLALPTDRPRPSVQTYHGATMPFAFSQALTASLTSLRRQEGVTLFMLLLAAFQVLLYRYTGQEDILVGTPTARRSRVEVERLIGCFANMLPLRTDLSGAPSFRALLGRVRRTALHAYAHRDVPFEKLVEALCLERDRSRNPLVQVIFDVQPAPLPSLDLPGLTVQTLSIDSSMVRFDLEFHLWETDGGLRGDVAYNTDLFDATTIARMVGHFETLLQGVVTDPEQRLSALPLLTEAERTCLLKTWNDTGTPYPRDACIPALFEAQVDRAPDAVALVFEDQHLSYAALDRRANALAHHLRALGVGPDVPVGLCVERSVEMVVGLLGILKAGGAYLPLDPSYPLERLALMLEETGAPVLLTQERLLARLPAHWGHLLCLDTAWEQVSGYPEARLPHTAHAGALAYVTYTSGSTGRPKGTCVVHRGVVRLVKQVDYVDLGPEEVFLHLAPLSFDASTFELWGSLLNGGRLVVMPPEPSTPAAIADAIRRHGVTTLWLTAALFQVMVDTHLEALAQVRQVLTGGDVLSVPHVQAYLRHLPKTGRLINGYGPTENTTFTTCFAMTSTSRLDASVPIGRPIANTQVYVLDRHRQPVPVGVVGELYAGGDGLARGYLNQPGLTAERFVPNPFAHTPTDRLYKTGDLVRYQPDGTLVFIGRQDRQVKLRGFRIEPEEIETVLRHHAGVRDCVVLTSADDSSDKRLIAYVVTDPNQPVSTSDLRDFLKDHLPAYMVPSVFIPLTELPMTPHGKVDRLALPASSPSQTGRPHLVPRTPVETAIAAVWRDVLQVEQVGLHDDFFELGGHSLLMPQVIVRLNEIFQVEVTLLNLLESPTVAGLARCIEGVRRIEQARPPDASAQAP